MFFDTVSVATTLCSLLVVPFGVSDAVDIEIDWVIKDYEDMEVTVGDSVTFRYNSLFHNLYIHPTGDCDESDRIMVGDNDGDDTYIFTEDDVGKTITFACDAFGHCPLGQIVDFVVSPAPEEGEPTPAPVSNPEINPEITVPCFSGNMEVDVQDKGTVAMEMLQVGDFIKTGNTDTYELVYAFGHRAPNKHTEFVQIHTDLDNPLEMTAEHLVFVEGKTNPVRADSIKVGDILQAQDHHAVVQSIKSVTKNGIYNPLTASGTIQVNGIAASTYVSFQKENNEYVELQGGIETPMSHHDLAHIAMAPFRFYCTALVVCDINDEYYHMPAYVSKGIALVEWRKKQHIAIQLVVWASILMVISVVMIMTCTAALMFPASLMSVKSIYKLQRIVSLASRSGSQSDKKNG